MSQFDVGQKVVCVDSTFSDWVKKLYTALPVKDSVYVVRDIQLGVTLINGKFEGAVCLLLVGLVNPKAESRAALERGFNSDRFRPLEEVREEANLRNQMKAVVEEVKECVEELEREMV